MLHGLDYQPVNSLSVVVIEVVVVVNEPVWQKKKSSDRYLNSMILQGSSSLFAASVG